MANYTVVDWESSVGTVKEVIAEMETKLETLDSTTNPIRYIDVVPHGGGGTLFKGIIIYDG